MFNIPCQRALAVAFLLASFAAQTAADDFKTSLEPAIDKVEPQVIAWRRDIHAHPELSNWEVRTSKLVADFLKGLGLEVRTGIAHHGVVGILRGGKPGPIIALRADMDALPVTEEVDVPFASKVKTQYNGAETGVMHACGHDTHTAMLMGAAEVLAGVKDRLPGTIMFIFQPAEEGAPKGEEGGAELMMKEGVFTPPDVPEAVFGLHVMPLLTGHLYVKTEGALAADDDIHITVKGTQTHAAMPWNGVDPITVAAQIVLALQTIASRQVNLTNAPAVISIGSIHGGNRNNIIPDQVRMDGTIRTLDKDMREQIRERVRRTVKDIADSAGATADVEIDPYGPMVYNDPALTQRMIPSLKWAAGPDNFNVARPQTGAEDFSYFEQNIPGMYVLLGINREGVGEWQQPPNHSPRFYVNEDALKVGVRAWVAIAVDYLAGAAH